MGLSFCMDRCHHTSAQPIDLATAPKPNLEPGDRIQLQATVVSVNGPGHTALVKFDGEKPSEGTKTVKMYPDELRYAVLVSRAKPKEMTLEEVQKELGRDIKIVTKD